MRSFFESMEHDDMPGFQTEMLCQWVDLAAAGHHPVLRVERHHRRRLSHRRRRKRYICVDVNYHRTRGYIGAAARRPDGQIDIVVVHEEKGTDWIPGWLADKDKDKFTAVTAQKTGAPVSGMIPAIEAAGVKVVEWGAQMPPAGGGGAVLLRRHLPGAHSASAAARVGSGGGFRTVLRTVGSDAWFFLPPYLAGGCGAAGRVLRGGVARRAKSLRVSRRFMRGRKTM